MYTRSHGAAVHVLCVAVVAAAASVAFESCVQHHSVYDDAFVLAMPDLSMPAKEWLETGRAKSFAQEKYDVQKKHNFLIYFLKFMQHVIFSKRIYCTYACVIYSRNIDWEYICRAEYITTGGASL